ncbi:MAG: DUF2934 domain-containing protein [Burkholderiales bacterium]|nr:DUF2934 domain-containing protein [Burkholderiales bacterium]
MPHAPTRTRNNATASKSKPPSRAAVRQPAIATNLPKGSSDAFPRSGRAVDAEERERLVAQAAYFRAEKRGFAPGGELQDWVEAEAEVLRLTGS